MKKLLCGTFVIIALLFITFTAGTAPENLRFAGAKAGLVLRETPDTSGKKIGLIPLDDEVTLLEEKGEPVTIAGKTGKWSKVTWKDKTGWVFGGFLKTDEEYAQTVQVPIMARIMGSRFSFVLNDDERADEIEILIDGADGFEGSCYLHGSGEAKFSGTFKSVENGDTVTLILDGTLTGFVVAETEQKIERKISKSKFIITRKDEKYYGSIDISPCESFKNREMIVK
jgi:hypothetical protein